MRFSILYFIVLVYFAHTFALGRIKRATMAAINTTKIAKDFVQLQNADNSSIASDYSVQPIGKKEENMHASNTKENTFLSIQSVPDKAQYNNINSNATNMPKVHADVETFKKQNFMNNLKLRTNGKPSLAYMLAERTAAQKAQKARSERILTAHNDDDNGDVDGANIASLLIIDSKLQPIFTAESEFINHSNEMRSGNSSGSQSIAKPMNNNNTIANSEENYAIKVMTNHKNDDNKEQLKGINNCAATADNEQVEQDAQGDHMWLSNKRRIQNLLEPLSPASSYAAQSLLCPSISSASSSLSMKAASRNSNNNNNKNQLNQQQKSSQEQLLQYESEHESNRAHNDELAAMAFAQAHSPQSQSRQLHGYLPATQLIRLNNKFTPAENVLKFANMFLYKLGLDANGMPLHVQDSTAQLGLNSPSMLATLGAFPTLIATDGDDTNAIDYYYNTPVTKVHATMQFDAGDKPIAFVTASNNQPHNTLVKQSAPELTLNEPGTQEQFSFIENALDMFLHNDEDNDNANNKEVLEFRCPVHYNKKKNINETTNDKGGVDAGDIDLNATNDKNLIQVCSCRLFKKKKNAYLKQRNVEK